MEGGFRPRAAQLLYPRQCPCLCLIPASHLKIERRTQQEREAVFTHATCTARREKSISRDHTARPMKQRRGLGAISQASLVVWKSAISTFACVSGCSTEETRGGEARVVKNKPKSRASSCACVYEPFSAVLFLG